MLYEVITVIGLVSIACAACIVQFVDEFDETPGKYPNNEGIYCRSYCPLHPEVHEVLFDLV